MEKFGKYWGIIAMVIGGIIGAAGWLYNQGAESKSTEGKIFDSPEQKVTVVKHVEDSPTPEQQQRQLILDSINTAHAIKSRAKRDSILEEEVRRSKERDSIMLLNADQMYQIKEILKNQGHNFRN